MPPVNESSVQDAIQALRTRKQPSIRAAAAFYEIDRETLRNRKETRTKARQNQRLLSDIQEEELVRWTLELEDTGHPLSHAQIRQMAGLISANSGGSPSCGRHWVSRFLQRHPELHTKIGRSIDQLRIQNTTSEALSTWFELYKTVKSRYNIKPENVWNMDETGLALGACKNQLVVGSSNSKYSYSKSPNNREWVSIIECISAGGKQCRPLCIFKGKNVQTSWFLPDNVPDWLYTTSENGWTSNDIGLRWLEEIFLPETAANSEPRLLLVDGHGSHASVEFMWKCHQNGVHLVYLIPHSSHVLQPLDLSCFSPLKSRYRAQIADLARYDDSAPVKKIQFIQYYEKARNEGLYNVNIKSGWRAAGIYPWDPRKVIRSSQVSQTTHTAKTTSISTPTTLERKRKASDSTQIITPQNKRQLDANLVTISQGQPISRDLRILIQKTGKTIDLFNARTAQQKLQIDAQTARLEQLAHKKQRKATVDANETFANIEKIKRTQEELAVQKEAYARIDRVKEARELSNQLIARRMEDFMFNFQIGPVGGEQNAREEDGEEA